MTVDPAFWRAGPVDEPVRVDRRAATLRIRLLGGPAGLVLVLGSMGAASAGDARKAGPMFGGGVGLLAAACRARRWRRKTP